VCFPIICNHFLSHVFVVADGACATGATVRAPGSAPPTSPIDVVRARATAPVTGNGFLDDFLLYFVIRFPGLTRQERKKADEQRRGAQRPEKPIFHLEDATGILTASQVRQCFEAFGGNVNGSASSRSKAAASFARFARDGLRSTLSIPARYVLCMSAAPNWNAAGRMPGAFLARPRLTNTAFDMGRGGGCFNSLLTGFRKHRIQQLFSDIFREAG
jgi:hypothetical protein